jgi:hypothetical protein
MSKFGKSLIESLSDAVAHANGEQSGVRIHAATQTSMPPGGASLSDAQTRLLAKPATAQPEPATADKAGEPR